MIKKLIPHYYIDQDSFEQNIIHDNLNFCISPYYDELPEEGKKIYNSLLADERVYTERMIKAAIDLLSTCRATIVNRRKNVLSEFPSMTSKPDHSKPIHPIEFLLENYEQQLKGIAQLENIFKL
jgi:hypothetical protein